MPPIARVLGLVLALAASQPASTEDFPSPFPPSDQGRLVSWDEPSTPEAQPGHPEEQTGSSPLPPPSRKPGLALSPPSGSDRTPQGTQAGRTGLLRSLITVASSLAVVLGLFFLVAWAMRRAAPRGSVLLPGEVVEVLGRAALATRGQVHVLRFGNKLLLVSVSPTGVETLAEITDREEVDRLAGLCRQAHPQSATAAFRHVFQQFTKQHAGSGFVDGDSREDAHSANTGIPRTRHGIREENDV
jgi:flagellar biogenesis protein FliO